MNPNVLNLDKWIEWNNQTFSSIHNKASFISLPKMKLELESLCRSEILKNNFLTYPKSYQDWIMGHIRQQDDSEDLGVVIDLCHQLQISIPFVSDLPKARSWVKSYTPNNLTAVLNNTIIETTRSTLMSDDSKKLDVLVSLFHATQCGDEDNPFSTRNPFIEIVPYLLTLVYGPERVIEVMIAWKESAGNYSLLEFSELVENWENVKHYPIDWAVNIIQEKNV